MRIDIGRFLEGRLLETVNLIKAVYDLATGEGKDVEAFVHGRELVFARREPTGAGFVRLLPQETSVVISFPRGPELFDPGKRLRGFPTARRSLTLRSTMQLDPYVRRLIDEAYRLDAVEEKAAGSTGLEDDDDFW